jgi:hypothetical protein
MSSKTDWMKSNRKEFYEQSGMTMTILEPNLEKFGIDGKSAEWVTKNLIPKYQAYCTAYLDWLDPSTRTIMKTATLKTAESEFHPVYRELYIGYLKGNKNITDADLLAMGLPARSSDKPTPSPIPSTYPDLVVEPDGIRRLKAMFRDHYSLKVAKPRGVAGAVLRWAILSAMPASLDELTNSVLDTKAPYVFTFDENQRGKVIYVSAAWQNTRGEMGAFGEIVSAIIP